MAKGRVCYGTTAGRFHFLDAATGRNLKSLDIGASITASPTLIGERLYFQSVEAVIYCMNLDGDILWTWDHYARYQPPLEEKLKRYHPGSYERPHYGGGEIAVSGKRLVTGIGWDHLCLEDRGDHVELKWCNRAALGKDAGIPGACSIANGYVYTAWPGVDGAGSLLRVSLLDGSFDHKQDIIRNVWAILSAPAVRGSLIAYGRHVRGVTLTDFGKKNLWSSYHWAKAEEYTPTFSSPVLTKSHCLFTTIKGELIAIPLDSGSSGGSQELFRFRTPNGRMITTTPAVSDGRVVFGCDDGCVYILSSDGKREPVAKKLEPQSRRSTLRPATGIEYDWATPGGDQAYTRFVHDPKLRPPFSLRWVVRSHGLFHKPMNAAGQDIVFVSMAGTVACLEQDTGRMRWRRRLSKQPSQLSGALCANGKIYLGRRSRRPDSTMSGIWCLDQESGATLWQKDTGAGASGMSRNPPVLAADCVAFASIQGKPPRPVVQALDADTGQAKWQVTLSVTPKRSRQRIRPPTGCRLGDVMYFSAGGMTDNDPKDRYSGETVAIQARTGKVLWRTHEAFTTGYSSLAARDDRLYVFAYAGPMSCLSAKDGRLIWKSKKQNNYFQQSPSLGPDFFAVKGYGGHTMRYRLDDCQPQNIKLGAPEHTCASAVLTSSELCLVASVGGLYVRDFNTGELLWRSERGFAPRNCANPAFANGRIFMNPQVNGMLYCFEPEELAP